MYGNVWKCMEKNNGILDQYPQHQTSSQMGISMATSGNVWRSVENMEPHHGGIAKNGAPKPPVVKAI